MSDTRAMPLREFARLIGPRTESRSIPGPGGRMMMSARTLPGTEEEVWLKLLAIRHPNERHSAEQWRKFIEQYGKEQAHPTHPEYKRA